MVEFIIFGVNRKKQQTLKNTDYLAAGRGHALSDFPRRELSGDG